MADQFDQFATDFADRLDDLFEGMGNVLVGVAGSVFLFITGMSIMAHYIWRALRG